MSGEKREGDHGQLPSNQEGQEWIRTNTQSFSKMYHDHAWWDMIVRRMKFDVWKAINAKVW